jgi:hypothetical protein
MARAPVVKRLTIGNYSQDVTEDPEGILDSTSKQKPMGKPTKVQAAYLKGVDYRPSAVAALANIRAGKKARKKGA